MIDYDCNRKYYLRSHLDCGHALKRCAERSGRDLRTKHSSASIRHVYEFTLKCHLPLVHCIFHSEKYFHMNSSRTPRTFYVIVAAKAS